MVAKVLCALGIIAEILAEIAAESPTLVVTPYFKLK